MYLRSFLRFMHTFWVAGGQFLKVSKFPRASLLNCTQLPKTAPLNAKSNRGKVRNLYLNYHGYFSVGFQETKNGKRRIWSRGFVLTHIRSPIRFIERVYYFKDKLQYIVVFCVNKIQTLEDPRIPSFLKNERRSFLFSDLSLLLCFSIPKVSVKNVIRTSDNQ